MRRWKRVEKQNDAEECMRAGIIAESNDVDVSSQRKTSA
jgi:hypothetical protein